MLLLTGVEVVYDAAVLVLRGVSLQASPGQITCLLGANGAGKTTALRAISGLLRAERGAVTSGRIEFNGELLNGRAPHEVVERGIVQVFEGRRVFQNLSVHDNLIAGGHTAPSARVVRDRLELVYSHFPRLRERRSQPAGYLSGGEQQMLAIGRAVMARPKLMLLDEPSLGLAPLMVVEIFRIVQDLVKTQGIAVLLVEQNVTLALNVSTYGFVMEHGKIVLQGDAISLSRDPDVKASYLGLTGVPSARKAVDAHSQRDYDRYSAGRPLPRAP